MIRLTLSQIVNVDFQFNERCNQQVAFPVRYGGLGIRSAMDLAFPAYLASVHSCTELVSQIIKGLTVSAENTIGHWSDGFGIEVPPANLRKHQRTWDEALLQRRFMNILNEAT